jgi:hypothetical protein
MTEFHDMAAVRERFTKIVRGKQIARRRKAFPNLSHDFCVEMGHPVGSEALVGSKLGSRLKSVIVRPTWLRSEDGELDHLEFAGMRVKPAQRDDSPFFRRLASK